MSSTKGALGHTQGAAGVLEAIVTIQAMERSLAPPTINFAGARPHGPPDSVPGPAPRLCRYDHAVSVNAAFGGANAAIIISRAALNTRYRPRRALVVRGLGLIGAFGQGVEDFVKAPLASRRGAGPIPDFDIERVVREVDPRLLDPSARFLTAAAALALRDAGVVVRGPLGIERDYSSVSCAPRRRASPHSAIALLRAGSPSSGPPRSRALS